MQKSLDPSSQASLKEMPLEARKSPKNTLQPNQKRPDSGPNTKINRNVIELQALESENRRGNACIFYVSDLSVLPEKNPAIQPRTPPKAKTKLGETERIGTEQKRNESHKAETPSQSVEILLPKLPAKYAKAKNKYRLESGRAK